MRARRDPRGDDHVHLQRHAFRGVREGQGAGRDHQPGRHQPHPVPEEARRTPRGHQHAVQPRAPAGGERDHRQARGSQVRLHSGAALPRVPAGAGPGRQAVRPARHDRLQRAQPRVSPGDRADALRPGGGSLSGAGDPVRVREPGRGIRHPLPPRADRAGLGGAGGRHPAGLRRAHPLARSAPAEGVHGMRSGDNGTLRLPGDPGPPPEAHLQGLRGAGRFHGEPDAARDLWRLSPHHGTGQGDPSPRITSTTSPARCARTTTSSPSTASSRRSRRATSW